MREMFSRKMVQRSPFGPLRQRLASERQQGVLNTTGRFAELATNVKHSSSTTLSQYMRGYLHVHIYMYSTEGTFMHFNNDSALTEQFIVCSRSVDAVL